MCVEALGVLVERRVGEASVVGDAVSGVVLTLAGPGQVVLPRRVRLRLEPGTGVLHVARRPATDPVWRASVSAGWAAARALTGRDDVDGHLEVVSPAPLQGLSAGLGVGLLSLSALLDRPLPDHLATGGVLPAAPGLEGVLPVGAGWLEGGAATVHKARSAAVLAPQLGMRDAVFLSPPVAPGSLVGLPMPVRTATDLGSAYAVLDPEGHALVAQRHAALRGAPEDVTTPVAMVAHAGPRWADRPEADVVRATGLGLTEVAVPADAVAGRAWVAVGERGRWSWCVRLPDDPGSVGLLPDVLELARSTQTVGPGERAV